MSLSVSIKKQLGSFMLDVSFETAGGILALLGASGCGKSMTLKCVAGIETPDSGRIVLNGCTLYDSQAHINLPPQKRRVGYLFQQYALFPNMTVAQNLQTAVRKLPRAEQKTRIEERLAAFHLDGLEKRRPAELSSGQQQRVALARILLSEPEALLLDEPFSALDDALKWKLELELMELLDRFAGDVIFVSHSRDEVTRLCTRVCVLTDGRSDEVTTVNGLMHAPNTVSAAKLSGYKNFSAAQQTQNGYDCADWGVTLRAADGGTLPADAVRCVGIRAHSLRFEPAENAIDCTVVRVIDNVFSYIVMLKTPGSGLLRMEFDKDRCTPPAAGERVCVYVRAEDILLLQE